MTISGLLIMMLISTILWVLGEWMKGGDKKSTPTEFQPTPPTWWERDIESFIRKYWVWIVLFIIWLGLVYIYLVFAIAHAAAITNGLPKPLPY